MRIDPGALALIGLLAASFTTEADVVRFMHTDLQGNVIAVTDESGAVIERYYYEPYGLPSEPTLDGPGYTGHEMDGDSGLVYMQQRYYNPETGRFLSVDPMAIDPSNAWNFNRYNYAANNPVSNWDPDGAVCVASFNMSFAMCQRSLRYHALHNDSAISSRTSFFGAASIVTSAMAFPFPDGFIGELSFALESANLARANQIRSGRIYTGGSIEANDRDFIRFEQNIVQDALNRFRASDQAGYDSLIAETNSFLNGYESTIAGISDPRFAQGLAAAKVAIGGDIDFANQEHRETLGRALADIARKSSNLCTGSHIRRC